MHLTQQNQGALIYTHAKEHNSRFSEQVCGCRRAKINAPVCFFITLRLSEISSEKSSLWEINLRLETRSGRWVGAVHVLLFKRNVNRQLQKKQRNAPKNRDFNDVEGAAAS